MNKTWLRRRVIETTVHILF